MAAYVRAHPIRAGVILIGGVILGTFTFLVSQVWFTFEAAAVESFNPQAASIAMLQRSDAQVAAAVTELSEAERALLDRAAQADLETLEFEDDLRDALAADRKRSYGNPAATGLPLADDMFDAYLGVGSDASGTRADTIILALAPTDGAAPILVSLPRDLYVQNPCTEGLEPDQLRIGRVFWSGQRHRVDRLDGRGLHRHPG